MRQLKTKPFPYYVGVYSLEELVKKEDRVCVINILGSESRKVTPVSHEYSNGNIVAGVQYGRRGNLETKAGDIPVYRSIREVRKHGIDFEIGVVYLPPVAVSQAVVELLTYNDKLKRIIIVTEKVSVRDSMYIRFLCQEAGVDVIGANCLGVANVWDNVRVGGALGGDNPAETLRPGTVAIYSNSGNFTTTIAEYIGTAGFGISTAVSSGKDVYIHFALAEFLFAAQNDPRTKAVALYVEPGGYYERMALDMIENRGFGFNKPIVVCVTGRWKKNINRACGHAGALAGGGDDAIAKEGWFDDYFGVGLFDPDNPHVSKRGVRIRSIQDFPMAMEAIYDKIDEKPDYASSGDLSLKCWISDNYFDVGEKLKVDIVEAKEPYKKQIREINRQIGINYLRQNMSDKSGASKMDRQSQVTYLHAKSVLELSNNLVEDNIYFSMAKVMPEPEDRATINMLLNIFLEIDSDQLKGLETAKRNSCTPNAYLASQILTLGNSYMFERIRKYSRMIIEMIRENDLNNETREYPEGISKYLEENIFEKKGDKELDALTEILHRQVKGSNKSCIPLQLCQYILEVAEARGMHIRDCKEFLIASISMCIFWKPLLEKRITRDCAENAMSYFNIIAKLVSFSVLSAKNRYWQELSAGKYTDLTRSFTENCFRILFGRDGSASDLKEFQYLIGLTLSNGPGTISAKGAKESVSARNNISAAFGGFLLNTGLAHGGNGYESVEYLLNIFGGEDIEDPGKSDVDIKSLAKEAAIRYRDYRRREKDAGRMSYKRIPCVNHPVFKGNDINIDPREDYVRKELEKSGISNVFWDFYHELVTELFNEGATRNVFCVNVDAVLSVIALKLGWHDYRSGELSESALKDLVFILFLVGRAIGVSAEIQDHRDRGLDMDCRTAQSKVSYVQ